MVSLRSKPLYLWDFYLQFSDLLDFLNFSERNLDWQRMSHVQSLNRRAELQKYGPDEYYSELNNIEYRFNVCLSRNIRYASVIALATAVERVATFLCTRTASKLLPESKEVNTSIHVLRTLFKMAGSNLSENLDTLEKIVKIRNCIAHAMGSVKDYKYGEEIRNLVSTLAGFRISNEDYIEEAIHLNKGAIEAIIQDTRKWIVEFIEECRKKNLITL